MIREAHLKALVRTPDEVEAAREGKDGLRARCKELRARRSAAERAATDSAIAARLFDLTAFQAARVIAPYLSFGTEVETRAIIERAWAAGKTVALPRCVPATRAMRWYAVTSLAGLARGPRGVLEPAEDPARELDLSARADALAVVPGLAFDARGFRLGYGGGYFDAFLSSFRGTSVGLCREAQLVESLRALGAVDAHDVPVGLVVTEARVLAPAQPAQIRDMRGIRGIRDE